MTTGLHRDGLVRQGEKIAGKAKAKIGRAIRDQRMADEGIADQVNAKGSHDRETFKEPLRR